MTRDKSLISQRFIIIIIILKMPSRVLNIQHATGQISYGALAQTYARAQSRIDLIAEHRRAGRLHNCRHPAGRIELRRVNSSAIYVLPRRESTSLSLFLSLLFRELVRAREPRYDSRYRGSYVSLPVSVIDLRFYLIERTFSQPMISNRFF